MKTLFDKIYEQHVVKSIDSTTDILFIDNHLVHEVTSPQAFTGIENRNAEIMFKERIVATADHNVPTENQHLPIKEALSRKQVQQLADNCAKNDIELYGLGHKNQGIVHVIGPELGVTQPGKTMVCGDSHTSTHGAFGAIAFGIGTSEVEMVMATQCLVISKPKTMRITVEGELGKGVTAKDVVLYINSKIGTSGGTGHFIEFAGSAIRSLTMEGRMSMCNMSIEMGARGGMVAPDNTTIEYMKGRPNAPQGKDWDTAVAYWNTLSTDEDATFDTEFTYDAKDIEPMITFGTNPGAGMGISQAIPTNHTASELTYMDFKGGEQLLGKQIDYIFIGSCTNSRIEDLRAVASMVKGKKKADNVNAFVVPGSKKVEEMAIAEGLDKILSDAGFELRQPGCSACLAMNEDKIPAGKYCVSTSNRNFEGRQGPGSRTLLASPITAAACALEGKITDPRNFLN